jgi:phospholipase C
MAGVRGYKDPNVAISDGKSVFYQVVNSTLSTKTDYLLPFYLNEQGGKWIQATQCMEAGSNGMGFQNVTHMEMLNVSRLARKPGSSQWRLEQSLGRSEYSMVLGYVISPSHFQGR